jgi:predicted RNA binding protein YcfA (HicA-like mRNA interferase family)
MSKKQKLFQSVVNSQKNLRFEDLILLAQYLGFELIRIKGSHHHFYHSTFQIKLNLQPNNNNAKPYQVKQLLGYIEEFGISLEDE